MSRLGILYLALKVGEAGVPVEVGLLLREAGVTVGERLLAVGVDGSLWGTVRDVVRRADAVCVKSIKVAVAALWPYMAGDTFRVLFFDLGRELPRVSGSVADIRTYDRLLCVSGQGEGHALRRSAIWEARVLASLAEDFAVFGRDGLPAYAESVLMGSPMEAPAYRVGGLCYGTAWKVDLCPRI